MARLTAAVTQVAGGAEQQAGAIAQTERVVATLRAALGRTTAIVTGHLNCVIAARIGRLYRL